MKLQKIVASLAILSMFAGYVPAQAKVGSVSSSSRSSPSRATAPRVSAPTPRVSAPRPAPAPAARPSGGMQRSNVMAQVRNPNPAAPVRQYGAVGGTTVATSTNAAGRNNAANNNGGRYDNRNGGYDGRNGRYDDRYDNRGGYNDNRQGFSGGTVAAAGLGGAVVGALAANAMHHDKAPVVINNGAAPVQGYATNGGYAAGGTYAQPVQQTQAYDADGYPVGTVAPAAVAGTPAVAYGAPAVVAAPVVYTAKSGFPWGWLLFFVLVGIVGYIVYRMVKGNNVNGFNNFVPGFASEEDDELAEQNAELNHAKNLLAKATDFFKKLQDANNRADQATLAAMVTADAYADLFSDIGTRETPSQTKVIAIDVVGHQVLGFESHENHLLGSIHFKGVVNEGEGQPNEPVNEVWHFTKDKLDGPWKLAGIEQV